MAPDFAFTEHKGGNEDHLGRLSMWRAYGGAAGVAMVEQQNIP
jgi:hypothetical protein